MDKEVQQDKYSDSDMSISIESMDLESPPKRRPYSDRPNLFLDTDGESISLESIDSDESDGGPRKNEMIAAILQRVKEESKFGRIRPTMRAVTVAGKGRAGCRRKESKS